MRTLIAGAAVSWLANHLHKLGTVTLQGSVKEQKKPQAAVGQWLPTQASGLC